MSSSVTNDELMRALKELTVQVQAIATALQAREDRREYHAKYYLKRKADKKRKETEVAQTRLPNTKGSHFCGHRMYNVPVKDWANALKQFADSGRSVFNWLTWLAWTWNQNTFVFSPITKSGGYFHVYIGTTTRNGKDAPLRGRYSQNDLVGQMHIKAFKTKTSAETFSSSIWWDYTFRTVGLVLSEVEDQPWFKQLSRTWHDVMRISLGQMGCYELGTDWCWEQTEEDLVKLSKGYNRVRHMLEPAMRATMKGWFAGDGEPFKAKPAQSQ